MLYPPDIYLNLMQIFFCGVILFNVIFLESGESIVKEESENNMYIMFLCGFCAHGFYV